MSRIVVALFVLAGPAVAWAQGDPDGPGIVVIDVSGPLDASALEFVADSIEGAAEDGEELVVLQINSKAILDPDSWQRAVKLVQNPPLPVAAWVGPSPAAAYGGAWNLVERADWPAIAPGSVVGLPDPVVLRSDTQWIGGTVSPTGQTFDAVESGLELHPTLRQYLQDLNGRTFTTADGDVEIATIRDFGEGVTLKPTTFKKPGFGIRFFRLAVTPEAAFFFLVAGLTIVTFEFFALGPGVAAGVGAISLLLGGWGATNLPVRPWALALTIGSWLLLTAAFQKGGILALAVLGAIAMQIGGMYFVDGQGQIDPQWYLVLPSVLAVLFFFLIAMPTVSRARLSTETIGRESLIGSNGTASSDFDPDGTVEVGGARWRATAHREAGIGAGDVVEVVGVDGLYLEVDHGEREHKS